jgi:hypothetical protein
MEKELVISRRAYLTLGPIEKPAGNAATFEIENHGHLPALTVSVDVEIIRPTFNDRIGLWNKQVAPIETLNPRGDPFRVIVSLPPDSGNLDDVLVSVTIEYGIGFKWEDAGGFQPNDVFRFA